MWTRQTLVVIVIFVIHLFSLYVSSDVIIWGSTVIKLYILNAAILSYTWYGLAYVDTAQFL